MVTWCVNAARKAAVRIGRWRNVANRNVASFRAAGGAAAGLSESFRTNLVWLSNYGLRPLSVGCMAPKSVAGCTCQCSQQEGLGPPPAGSQLPSEPLTYSLAEAAQRIGGVTARSLADEFRAGLVSGYKIGRQWRMTEDDIRSYIDQRRILPRHTDSTPTSSTNEPVKPPQQQRQRKHPASSADDQISLFG